jgi:hypothetical protein
MRVPDPGVSLRPLGVGEILDRAVTLCVRHFIALATIYVVYAIPLAIVSFASAKQLQRFIGLITQAAQSGHGTPTTEQINAALVASPVDSAFALAAVVFTLLIGPLPNAALIESVTAFSLGRTSSFKQAYRVALDRYFNMLGVTFLFVLVAGALYIVFAILAFVFVLLVALVVAASQTAGIILGIVVGTIATVALLGIALVAVLAFQLAYFSCVVERASFVEAFARSLRRVYSRVGLRRSLLVGLIYAAIGIGIGLVSIAGQGLGIALFHSPIVASIYETIIRVATAAFTIAYIGAFYLDLRVREEGLDLQLQTEPQLSAAIPQP